MMFDKYKFIQINSISCDTFINLNSIERVFIANKYVEIHTTIGSIIIVRQEENPDLFDVLLEYFYFNSIPGNKKQLYENEQN